jgi:cell division protein FtsA
LGYGYYAAKGMKNGVVVDVNQATIAVCNAVEAAEQMANERITNVIVNVSGERTRSVIRSSIVGLHKNRPVSDEDVKKVTDKGLMKVNVEGNEPIHFLTMGYHVDNCEEVKNPINIYGDNLSVDILLGLYPKPMYKNLALVVESSHLDVEMRAFSAYASGLACLVEDERELGATVIDIGGGTTSIATFKNGHPVYFACLPVGGINVTNDIALGLTTSFSYAEEIKNRHGCAFLISQDEQEAINVYPVGEEDDSNIKQIYRSDLINIISPRIEEIFELVGRKLDEAGYKNTSMHRVVLTGGASQLPGMREVASMVLDKQVRIGRPRNIENIPPALHNPTFSTALGLLLFAVNNSERKIIKKVNVSAGSDGIFAKIFELFKKTC